MKGRLEMKLVLAGTRRSELVLEPIFTSLCLLGPAGQYRTTTKVHTYKNKKKILKEVDGDLNGGVWLRLSSLACMTSSNKDKGFDKEATVEVTPIKKRMDQEMELLLSYPSILPVKVDSEGEEYSGYLPVNGTDYYVHLIKIKQKVSLKKISPKPRSIRLTSLQEKNDSIHEFLDNLVNLISSQDTLLNFHGNQVESYKLILNEYTELKEFYINIKSATISSDLSEIKIQYMDEFNRIHHLNIITSLENPEKIFKVHWHSLPDRKSMEKDMFEAENSLKAIYEMFLRYIDMLQPYFRTIDALDSNCWILDPENGNSKEPYRRIALDTNLSIIVTIDPWKISTNVPGIKFLGPERLTEAFRQKTAENLINWNTNADIVEELLKLLELPNFPICPHGGAIKEGTVVLYDANECCICFSLRLNAKLPEITCQNRSCEQNFHQDCLYQWLVSVGAKRSFNELHGHCPNCEKKISCPL